MNFVQKQALLRALWPEGSASRTGVWGILDCARDPKIYLALLESRLEFRCLYSGRLPRALEMNAPHLVELFPDNRLTQRWLEEGWGEAWGVMLRIDDPANLRHHLRKFLKVQEEGGRILLFRYSDPRVLGTFLRSCDKEQLRQFFGPIEAFMSEEAEGQAFHEFSLRGGTLRENELAPVTDLA